MDDRLTGEEEALEIGKSTFSLLFFKQVKKMIKSKKRININVNGQEGYGMSNLSQLK